MPGQIRSNKKAMKIAYDVLKIPKEKQQDSSKKPSKATLDEWSKDIQKHR